MPIKEIVEDLFIQFLKRSNETRPLIVGIDGLGGAGKTSLVKDIERELTTKDCKVTTFHLDNHIVEKNKRYQTGYEEWYEYYYLQWDLEGLSTKLFTRLHHGCNRIHLPCYDRNTDSTSTKQINVISNSIVLIESVFLQREEWRSYFDFVIYLDCPEKLREKRILNRDSYIGDNRAIVHKYENRYWLAEKHYLETIKPMERADLVFLKNGG